MCLGSTLWAGRAATRLGPDTQAQRSSVFGALPGSAMLYCSAGWLRQVVTGTVAD